VQWFQLYETNPQLIGSILKALGQNFDDYRIYATVSSDVVLVARKHEKFRR
jgi:hypothetical protein